ALAAAHAQALQGEGQGGGVLVSAVIGAAGIGGIDRVASGSVVVRGGSIGVGSSSGIAGARTGVAGSRSLALGRRFVLRRRMSARLIRAGAIWWCGGTELTCVALVVGILLGHRPSLYPRLGQQPRGYAAVGGFLRICTAQDAELDRLVSEHTW